MNRQDNQNIYKFVTLNNATAASYERLTYPTFRTRMRALDHDGSTVALGVDLGSQPIGLILAETSTDRKSAEILSLFVVPEHRGHGLGKTLLTYVEEELYQRGSSQINLVYVSNETTPALERILKQRNWSNPQLRMLVCSGPISNIKDACWLKLHNSLPSSYTIFPWVELTQQERELIQKQQASSVWYPEILSPFQQKETIEPLNSLGLRYQNQVVGWMITHRVAADTVRYTKLFVREDLQPLGRAIPLLATAIRLQLESRETTEAVFTVVANNTPMVRFVYRRLAPYLTSVRQSWGSSKLLAQLHQDSKLTYV
jgi:GNAT superfamily N-acetyltransferase